MHSLMNDLYDPVLHHFHMASAAPPNDYGPAGRFYRLDRRGSCGAYWVYFRDNLFAVNAFDFAFLQAGRMRYRPVEHLSISYYESVEGFAHNSENPLQSGTIASYLADGDGEYLASFRQGGHVRGTTFTISPDYYRDYLQARFGAIPDVRRAFALVDGRRDAPDLIGLFKKVRAYRGSGMTADLFYEGAVSEAVALVIERAAELEAAFGKEGRRRLSQEDRRTLERLEDYIKNNPGAALSCEELARRSCMGQTKLKQAFREVFGASPAAFVAKTRIECACKLLTTSDLPIFQIALAVGYRKPGAFAEAFRRCTGVAPSDYRCLRP